MVATCVVSKNKVLKAVCTNNYSIQGYNYTSKQHFVEGKHPFDFRKDHSGRLGTKLIYPATEEDRPGGTGVNMAAAPKEGSILPGK